MSNAISLILDADGLVVNQVVGAPVDLKPADGQSVLALEDAPAGVGRGWTRQADGTWLDPSTPRRPTEDDLIAYAHEAHLAAEVRGTTGPSLSTNEP